jgi:hypothetical protein
MATKTKPQTTQRFADGAVATKKRRTKPGKISLKSHPGEDGAPSPTVIARNRRIIAAQEAAVRAGKIQPVYLDSAGRIVT